MSYAIIKLLQKNAWIITISLWGFGLAFAGFNLYITSKLAPLTVNLAAVTQAVEANELKDTSEHANFVTQNELKQITIRLDRISGRVDEIIGILIR